MKPNGAIFYRGPSLIDGSPIVGIVTGLSRRSKNPKTGDMLHTWILRSHVNPLDAADRGLDRSICGDCALRGDGHKRGCYVRLGDAPLSIYRAYKRGSYRAPLDVTALRGRAIRFGAYGDPAAVPTHVWQLLASVASTWSGYTHQWRTCDPQLRSLCMASVETIPQMDAAKFAGWRTFRMRPSTEYLPVSTEVVCPASVEAGKLTTCADCGLCRGTSNPAKGIVISAHGPGASGIKRAATLTFYRSMTEVSA